MSHLMAVSVVPNFAQSKYLVKYIFGIVRAGHLKSNEKPISFYFLAILRFFNNKFLKFKHFEKKLKNHTQLKYIL